MGVNPGMMDPSANQSIHQSSSWSSDGVMWWVMWWVIWWVIWCVMWHVVCSYQEQQVEADHQSSHVGPAVRHLATSTDQQKSVKTSPDEQRLVQTSRDQYKPAQTTRDSGDQQSPSKTRPDQWKPIDQQTSRDQWAVDTSRDQWAVDTGRDQWAVETSRNGVSEVMCSTSSSGYREERGECLDWEPHQVRTERERQRQRGTDGSLRIYFCCLCLLLSLVGFISRRRQPRSNSLLYFIYLLN